MDNISLTLGYSKATHGPSRGALGDLAAGPAMIVVYSAKRGGLVLKALSSCQKRRSRCSDRRRRDRPWAVQVYSISGAGVVEKRSASSKLIVGASLDALTHSNWITWLAETKSNRSQKWPRLAEHPVV
jgi:hypothetical protein